MQSCDKKKIFNCGFNGTLSYHLCKLTTTTTTIQKNIVLFLMQKIRNVITYAMRTNKNLKRIFQKW